MVPGEAFLGEFATCKGKCDCLQRPCHVCLYHQPCRNILTDLEGMVPDMTLVQLGDSFAQQARATLSRAASYRSPLQEVELTCISAWKFTRSWAMGESTQLTVTVLC
jgi:hypothetical protein